MLSHWDETDFCIVIISPAMTMPIMKRCLLSITGLIFFLIIMVYTGAHHDETGHTWHHSDQDLFEMTKYGVGTFAGEGYTTRMPIYQDMLSDSEILAVLSFIKSRWPTQVIQIHNEQVNSSQ